MDSEHEDVTKGRESELQARVDLLEKKLEEAIDLLVARDSQLDATEMKVRQLQQELEDLQPGSTE